MRLPKKRSNGLKSRAMPFSRLSQFARTSALRKYQEFSAKSSFVAAIRIDLKYFIAKTAIVRVLP